MIPSEANEGNTHSEEANELREQTPPSIGSDGEGGERTARERLKKTSIAGLHQHLEASSGVMADEQTTVDATSDDITTDQTAENGAIRGRPSKKRSFEDLQKDEQGPTENGSASVPDPKRSSHKRMRSRDVQHGSDEYGRLEEMGSPVQEETGDDARLSPGGPGVLVDAPSKEQLDKQAQQERLLREDTTNEPLVGGGAEPMSLPSTAFQHPQQSSEEQKLQPSSGFANTSSASPFGAVKSPQAATSSPPPPAEPVATSSSAFASSGLSAFASADKSPFGATNSKPSGGFGSASTGGFGGTSSGGFGGLSAPAKGFGSTSTGFGGVSPFATSSSGFGGASTFGSSTGFGGVVAPKSFGGGISTFASSSASSNTFTKAKPFGTKDEEDEDGSDDGEDEDKQDDPEEEHQDSRFHEQERKSNLTVREFNTDIYVAVETGEEEEDTIFSSRAKLFHFETSTWKERGVGVFKINVRYESRPIAETNDTKDEEAGDGSVENGAFSAMERRARMIMRTDGVHKVILNSQIFKEMNVGTPEGEEPTGKTMHLTGLEDGRPRGFQIRVR